MLHNKVFYFTKFLFQYVAILETNISFIIKLCKSVLSRIKNMNNNTVIIFC